MSVMRHSLGALWWETKKAEITEDEAAEKKKKNIGKAQKRALQKKQKEREVEEIVRTQLGSVSYYLLPWQRKKIRDRINAIHVDFDKEDARNNDIRICKLWMNDDDVLLLDFDCLMMFSLTFLCYSLISRF